MIIEHLSLKGFRNIKQLDISFNSSSNLIFGENGAGKTSILESLFILAYAKSFLNVKRSDIVNTELSEFYLKINCKGLNGNHEIRSFYDCSNFFLSLNGKKASIVDINQHYYPVFFSSSDYIQSIESRGRIRKMIDRFIFGVEPLYIHYIVCYNRALKQKNRLLKMSVTPTHILSWNKVICEMAAKIVDIRLKYIDMLNKELNQNKEKDLKVNYFPTFDISDGISENNFFQQLETARDTEIRAARSIKGTHLDNYNLELNGKDLKFFSSGEKKIHLLLVYIAAMKFYRTVKNDYPLFLIDDYDTAIDSSNIKYLIENYPDMQVIATSVNKNTDFNHLIEIKKEN